MVRNPSQIAVSLLLLILFGSVACSAASSNSPSPSPSILEAAAERSAALWNLSVTDSITEGELGSRSRPVSVEGPMGERQYLARLRCADGSAVEFDRLGSNGGTADEHTIDDYIVHCEADGTTGVISMDMYHPGPPPQVAVPGYALLPDLPARTARGCPPEVHADPDSVAAYAFNMLEVQTPPMLLSPPPDDSDSSIFVTFVVGADGRVEPGTFETLSDDSDAASAALAWLETLQFEAARHHEDCRVRFRVEAAVPVP